MRLCQQTFICGSFLLIVYVFLVKIHSHAHAGSSQRALCVLGALPEGPFSSLLCRGTNFQLCQLNGNGPGYRERAQLCHRGRGINHPMRNTPPVSTVGLLGRNVVPRQPLLCTFAEREHNDKKDVDPNAGRFVRYQFTPAFLRLRQVGAT